MLPYVLKSFLLVVQKFFSIDHNIAVLNLSFRKKKYNMCPVLPFLFSNDKTKSLFNPWKLGLIK